LSNKGSSLSIYGSNWSHGCLCLSPSNKAGSLKMNTALEYSTRVVQEGGRRCKKSTLNDLLHLTPIRIPLMNPPIEAVPGASGAHPCATKSQRYHDNDLWSFEAVERLYCPFLCLASSKILTASPPPHHPTSVYPPPLERGEDKGHTRWVERG
jgi:hypothetical protein